MAKDVRLQKMLADCGVASRRKAEELIANGRVKVNGRVAKIGDKVDTKKDKITVDNKTVVSSVRSVYYMLHKPRGFITTMSDEMGRKCVAEYARDKGFENTLFLADDGYSGTNLSGWKIGP